MEFNSKLIYFHYPYSCFSRNLCWFRRPISWSWSR